MEDLLIPATKALLRAHGGDCEPRPRIEPGGAIVATIGFAGSDIQGALALLALEPAVRTLVADIFDTVPDTDALLCDMVGELSNMLLGRYRSELLRAGVEILSATPITMRAHDVDIRGEAGRSASWHAFSTSAGPFWLCLNLSFREGFVFPAPNAESIQPNEQELVFFE